MIGGKGGAEGEAGGGEGGDSENGDLEAPKEQESQN